VLQHSLSLTLRHLSNNRSSSFVMSEDTRIKTRKGKVLYVANPGSGDSDEASDDDRPRRPSGSGGYPNSFRRPQHSNAYSNPNPNPPYKLTASNNHPPPLTTIDLTSIYSHHQTPHPPQSSPSTASSPAVEDPTPLPPVTLPVSPPEIPPSSYQDPTIFDSRDLHQPSTSRAGKLLQTIKAPFGRVPKTTVDSSPRRPKTVFRTPNASSISSHNIFQSPTVSTPDSYSSVSSYTSTSTASDKIIIVVTADSERYVTVDVSGAKSAAFIRECIFTKVSTIPVK
jgi:hypothetical protein